MLRFFEPVKGYSDNKDIDALIAEFEEKEQFEKADQYRRFKETNGINLPQRQTQKAAGYDFEAAETVTIPPIWRTIWYKLEIQPILVPTGVKAYMQEDEALFLYNRSSNSFLRFLLLDNGVGVVDADYYSNPKNDGHIHFSFWNFGLKERVIHKGDRIGQGVFKKFLLTDDDSTTVKKTRKGGRGSTNE